MRKLKNLLRPLMNWLRFQRETFSDGMRHFRNTIPSGSGTSHAMVQLESDIVRRYHVLEKGLSMPDFRPRFGQPIASQLIEMVCRWDRKHSVGGGANDQIEAARATLHAYRNRHQSIGVDVSDIFVDFDLLDQSFCSTSEREGGAGGVRMYQEAPPEDLHALSRMLHARCSVRHFDSTRVPERAGVERALAAAIRSPSVCNRQTWRAHLYEGELAQQVLALQDGNRGFGHTIPAVFVVASDLRYFGCLNERNQSYIDGGMFAMSLLLGLQAEGYGAVALNWCVQNERDRELRQTASIPDYERIIMIIGFGYPAEGCVVPVSRRRPVSSILRIHT